MQFQRFFHAMSIAAVVCCTLALTAVAQARGLECSGLFREVRAEKAQPRPRNERAFYISEFSRKPNDQENGFITDQVPVNAESLVEGYRRGMFPYETTAEGNGSWFSPPKRGVMSLDFKIGASDRKALRKLEEAVARGELRVSFNEAFEQVIRECAKQPRMRRNPRTFVMEPAPSWISEEIIQGYTSLHKLGKAVSVEVWRKTEGGGEELVGGTYGVIAYGVFTGESMFHTMPDVTKLATVRLGAHLKSRGFSWIDVQVAPPETTKASGEKVKTSSLSVKWGAVEVSRDEFNVLRQQSFAAGLTWSDAPVAPQKPQASIPYIRIPHVTEDVVPQTAPDTLMYVPAQQTDSELVGEPL